MKLTSDWLTHPGTIAVFEMLSRGGHGAWVVGGAVRNSLLNVPVDDVDITTDARPERVSDLAKEAGCKVVPTGIEHGTVTVIVHDHPFEITTLRRDVSTDGRRATVQFTDQLSEDAARRDFTINALYAAADGTVLDPLGQGLEDLASRRVRFIGAAGDRIAEDYLRVLRFFRFFAWYGADAEGLDADGLAACAVHLDGLEHLSRERVGAEMKKLLLAPNPSTAMAAMAQSGVLAGVLPGADPRLLPILVHFEDVAADAMRRLALLGGDEVASRLRLSKADGGRLSVLRTQMASTKGPSELGYRFGTEIAWDVLLLRAALFETAPDVDQKAIIARGAAATFPVKAKDLMPTLSGPALGAALKRLEDDWIASDFAMSKQDLLQTL